MSYRQAPGAAPSAGERVYRSAVDRWLVILIGVIAVGITVLAVRALRSAPKGMALWVIGILAFSLLQILRPLASTRYTLGATALRVVSGSFRREIPYAEIRSITPTRDLATGPALSLDRLRIDYGQGQSILISPADRAGFLAELARRRA